MTKSRTQAFIVAQKSVRSCRKIQKTRIFTFHQTQEEKKGDLSYVFNRKTARNVLMHKKGREMWQEMSLETSDGERTRAKPWT